MQKVAFQPPKDGLLESDLPSIGKTKAAFADFAHKRNKDKTYAVIK